MKPLWHGFGGDCFGLDWLGLSKPNGLQNVSHKTRLANPHCRLIMLIERWSWQWAIGHTKEHPTDKTFDKQSSSHRIKLQFERVCEWPKNNHLVTKVWNGMQDFGCPETGAASPRRRSYVSGLRARKQDPSTLDGPKNTLFILCEDGPRQ